MSAESEAKQLSVLVVMGVSGAGKSTIAALLALRLGWAYEDADWFHPPANIEKMHCGHPLTDEDRWPWLEGIAAWIDATRRASGHGVIACSALKHAYRDVLIGDRPWVRLVYLKGERSLVARRIAPRQGHHFMPASLLDSQFGALQEPGMNIRSSHRSMHALTTLSKSLLRSSGSRPRDARTQPAMPRCQCLRWEPTVTGQAFGSGRAVIALLPTPFTRLLVELTLAGWWGAD